MHKILGLFVALAFGCVAVSQDVRAADPRPDQQKLPHLVHFGNMGGLLPTLERSDLPAPDSHGAKLVFKYCVQCHNAPGPGMHTAAEWKQVVWRMYWRLQVVAAQFKEYEGPTYEEGHVIEKYMARYAMHGVNFNDVPLKEEGAKEYTQICNQCHQLPDPKLHKGEAWRNTVYRMVGHMKSMGRIVASNDQKEKIIGYLQSQAKK